MKKTYLLIFSCNQIIKRDITCVTVVLTYLYFIVIFVENSNKEKKYVEGTERQKYL